MRPASEVVVDVVAGSLSPERDVSLRSGRRVADSLRQLGVSVAERDLDAATFQAWRTSPVDCVVPLVHGAAGEDGALATLLEVLDLPFVGSPSTACRLTFDKAVAKAHLAAHDLPSPDFIALPHAMFRELGAAQVMAAVVDALGLPAVVKPTRGGSAMGVSLVNELAELSAALVAAFAYSDTVLVERYVPGIEVAVCLLQDQQGLRALPSIEITPRGRLYDYDARYTAGHTTFTCPPGVDTATLSRAVDVARTAHQVLGLRDWSRADLIIDQQGQPWILEMNAAPGMTETSLYPQALNAAAMDVGATVLNLVTQAIERASNGPASTG